MYNVVEMKSDYAAAVKIAREKIEDEFVAAFQAIYPGGMVMENLEHPSTLVENTIVRANEDIDRIYYGEGFYVILTDRPVDGNECRLRMGELRAIYRGECRETRLRVRSHLANAAYHSELAMRAEKYERDPKYSGRRFYKATWPHCLKLDGKSGTSGINIDQAPHSGYRWQVLVHRMKDSSQEIRKFAESAFDRAFGKPAASREKGAT